MNTTIKRTHLVSYRIAAGLGLFAAALGVIALAAWVFDLTALQAALDPHGITKANAALGIAAAGLGLFAFTALPRANPVGYVLRRAGGILPILIGALTLLQH